MKKYLIILVCLLAGGYNASAKIWRVNNNAGIACDFKDFAQSVIDDSRVQIGDTIHIEGSATSYTNSVIVNKKALHIFGPGYYLSNNLETQHIKQPAKVGTITITADSVVLAGVEHDVSAQANTTGFTVAMTSASATTWTGPRVIINANYVKVINSRLYVVEINNNKELNDIDIKKSWLGPGVVRTTGTSIVSNLNIMNNFFRNDGTGNTVIDLNVNVKARISNNTFYKNFAITTMNTGAEITRNAFYRAASTTTSSVTVENSSKPCKQNISNYAWTGVVENGEDNYVTAATDPLTWFSGSGNNEILDAYFASRSGSPSPLRNIPTEAAAIKEYGMYGGLAPYGKSGLTAIPAVYEIVMPSEVSSDGFEVTVKVMAH